jgi:Flp pilus assembly protein TadD
LSPSNAGYLNARAWALFKSGRAAEGLPDVEKSLQLRPNIGQVVKTLAHILEELGRKEEAIVQYKKAIELDQNDTYSIESLKRLEAK